MASKRGRTDDAEGAEDDDGAYDDAGGSSSAAPGGGQLVQQQQQQQQSDRERSMALAKRPKTAEENAVLRIVEQQGIQRTSSLLAPIMHLTGHEGAVYSARFSPSGEHIASGSFDRSIFLWSTAGDCPNYNVLKGHRSAVLDVVWSWDGSHVFSASVDRSGAAWDAETGERVKKLRGHSSYVNSVSRTSHGSHLVCTGSDDGHVIIHDIRAKHYVHNFKHGHAVTAVCFNESGDQIFTGSIDNKISTWDLRKQGVAYAMAGHMDTVTSLRLSPDGGYLLSNAMDNTVRLWDVKPFAPAYRCLKVFDGAAHGIEQTLMGCTWSKDGTEVAAGSADRTVVIWDVGSRRITYKLPGHKGCVNTVDFHPKEPIICSGSSDKSLFLGEIAAAVL